MSSEPHPQEVADHSERRGRCEGRLLSAPAFFLGVLWAMLCVLLLYGLPALW